MPRVNAHTHRTVLLMLLLGLAALVGFAAIGAAAPAAHAKAAAHHKANSKKHKKTKCKKRKVDLDGDCIVNGKDKDIDGDGIPNWRDKDMDGDGIPNSRDKDIDGDGIPNTKDRNPYGLVVKGTKFGTVAPGRTTLSGPGGPPASAGGVTVPRSFFGIVSEDALAQTGTSGAPVMATLSESGVGLLRQTFSWANIESHPGVWDFSAYDNFVGDAARHNIQLLPVLFDPPAFRAGGTADHGTYPPASNDDFAAFAVQLVQRYGPGGQFWATHPDVPAVPITAWQVWNEPNLPVYWASGPNPAKYAEMLRTVHTAIKSVDPGATVVTAGLPDSRLGQPAADFLAGMYAAGAKGSFEALGANPYATTADGVLENLKALRSQMNRVGDSAQLWATEIGWADGTTAAPFDLGAQGQAAALAQTLPLLVRNSASLGLHGVVYYAWRDLPVYQGGRDFWGLHTGLVRGDGSAKPALQMWTDIVRQLAR